MIKILSWKLMTMQNHQNIKIIFGKGYVSNWSDKVFVIRKVKNTFPWTYVIKDVIWEEIVGTFYEKGLQKTNQIVEIIYSWKSNQNKRS